MSFDVFPISFRHGIGAPADATSANVVVQHHRYQHDGNAYVFTFDDGVQAELFARGLDGTDEKPFAGGMFALRGISDAVATFILEFARASGCVIIPAMEPPCVLIPSEDLAVHLPSDLAAKMDHIVVNTGPELAAALNGGLNSWQAYRDKVRRASGGGPTSH